MIPKMNRDDLRVEIERYRAQVEALPLSPLRDTAECDFLNLLSAFQYGSDTDYRLNKAFLQFTLSGAK